MYTKRSILYVSGSTWRIRPPSSRPILTRGRPEPPPNPLGSVRQSSALALRPWGHRRAESGHNHSLIRTQSPQNHKEKPQRSSAGISEVEAGIEPVQATHMPKGRSPLRPLQSARRPLHRPKFGAIISTHTNKQTSTNVLSTGKQVQTFTRCVSRVNKQTKTTRNIRIGESSWSSLIFLFLSLLRPLPAIRSRESGWPECVRPRGV